MRSLIMAAAADISCFTAGVSAEPLIVIPNPMVQQADFYCGPQCQKHRDLEHQRVERHEQWRESRHYPPRNSTAYYRGY